MDWMPFILKGAEAGIGALASFRDASTASTAGQFNQQVALQNAEMERMNAVFVRRRTELRIDAVRRNAVVLEGEQRAAYGASGVSAGSGSAVDVYRDTAAQAALDVEIIRMEGEQEVRSLEKSADIYESQADIERWTGERKSKGFQLAAGSSLLSGAADMYDMWKKRGT